MNDPHANQTRFRRLLAPTRRRAVLAAGAGAVAVTGLSLAAVSLRGGGHPKPGVRFTLNAEVLDGGEQVTSITIDTAGLGRIDPAGLTTGMFGVHARATSPIRLGVGDRISSEYDLDRQVTAVRLDERNRVVLDLSHGEDQIGGGTLGFIMSRDRNVRLNLAYTVTQHAPIVLRDRRSVMIPRFVQGRLSSPEVDAFGSKTSGSGLKYRLYSPAGTDSTAGSPGNGSGGNPGSQRFPLVVWLHGSGEGASLSDHYYDNETTLRANRGALAFATAQAQRVFSGAYVVAPQCTSAWMADGPRFAPLIREVIDDLLRRHPIDRSRVYIAGCSSGGYMTMKMTAAYPDLFAASVPICGLVDPRRNGGSAPITDVELAQIRTPTWLVASRNDTTVPPQSHTVHAHELIPGSLMTLYDQVRWNDHEFNGHWSWICVARNDPTIDGTALWQWMARQRR